MADTDILVSEMTPASQINTTDLMIMTQPDAQAETGYSTKSGTVLQVANKMLKGTEYSTDLPDFTDKTPLGGLEELKADIKALLPVDSASGNPCNFETNIADTLVSLKASITASGGNGTPSTPIPIVGHSELNLVRCGKNLLDYDFSDATSGAKYVQFKVPNGTYTMSTSAPLVEGAAILFFLNGYQTSGVSTGTNGVSSGIPRTVTVVDNYFTVAYRYIGTPAVYPADFNTQIELGSTATPYAPYNGQTFTVQFGQTVYGGVYTADGKLNDSGYLKDTFTYGETALIAINQYGIANFGIVISTPFDFSKGAIANCLERQYTSGADTRTEGFFINASNELYVRLDSTRASTVDEFLAWANANLKILFTRTTPIEIDVSELSVDTIVGVNNITSDCGGDVEVEYRDSIQHYIDKKIAETQALIL